MDRAGGKETGGGTERVALRYVITGEIASKWEALSWVLRDDPMGWVGGRL